MKDRELIEKRLAHIAEAVASLRSLARPDALETDPVQRGFVEHTLQTAIQSALDVASAIVAERRLGEPKTNAAMFDLLAADGWLATDRVDVYHRVVAFRNVLVHRYLDVDPAIVRAILADHLDDLLDFARAIRDRLDG